MAVAALVAFGIGGAPARAITEISSSAFDIETDVSVLGLVLLNVGPFSQSAGAAPAPYSTSNTELAANAVTSVNIGINAITDLRTGAALDTGVLTTVAGSTYDGANGFPAGRASANIDGLTLDFSSGVFVFGSQTLGVDILSIGLDAVTSQSEALGRGALSVNGDTTIAGLTLSSEVAGLSAALAAIDTSAFVNPDPNTLLIDLLGLRIVLNEQIVTGNGVDGIAIQTNAIHIVLNDLAFGLLGGVLNGDIVIASSQAQIQGPAIAEVPEPAVWLQMISGFALAGFAVRRRRANGGRALAA